LTGFEPDAGETARTLDSGRNMIFVSGAATFVTVENPRFVEHDPKTSTPVLGKDHAQTSNLEPRNSSNEIDCRSCFPSEADEIRAPVDLDAQAIVRQPNLVDKAEASDTETAGCRARDAGTSLARIAGEIRAQQMTGACFRPKPKLDQPCQE